MNQKIILMLMNLVYYLSMILLPTNNTAKIGNARDVIKSFAITNLIWNGLEKNNSLSIDFRVYVPEENRKKMITLEK